MRNKLPILLALVLMAIAAMPWLKSLESQYRDSSGSWSRFGLPSWVGGPTTVPPPAAIEAPTTSPRASEDGKAVGTTERPHQEASPRLPPSQPAQIKPQTLLDNAVLAVENQPRISAQISEDGELFGHPMQGRGRYFEVRQGPIPLIHLEMTLQVDSVTTSLVQVCNGTTLWTYRKLPDNESLWKIDAVRAITALEQVAGRLPPGQVAASPGLGGLGRLIRGLNSQFVFSAAVPDEAEGTAVWKLSGVWKPDVLARLLPDQKDAAAKGRPYDTAKLAGHLPDAAIIFLRQSDYFPLRIDFHRNTGKSPHCVLSIKFGDLNFTAPIDSGQFVSSRPAASNTATAPTTSCARSACRGHAMKEGRPHQRDRCAHFSAA